jgi:hypothetical protein
MKRRRAKKTQGVDTSDRARYWLVPDEYLDQMQKFFARGGSAEGLAEAGFVKGRDGKYYRDIRVGAGDRSDRSQYRPLPASDAARVRNDLFIPGRLALMGRMGDIFLGNDGKFYVYIPPATAYQQTESD